MKFRYKKEPWLPTVLQKIAEHESILEVGCGQGTDALYCCGKMKPGGFYTGVDYSDQSVKKARESAEQILEKLKVVPVFQVGNAEALNFEDGTFDCVASLGVLHHTPDMSSALSEVFRVLKNGGALRVTLYRTQSPKLMVAHFIRLVSRFLDILTRKQNYLYNSMKGMSSSGALGTMIHECVGVPVLRSFTRGQIKSLFADWEIEKITPVGMGFPFIGINDFIDRGFNPIGAQWLIEIKKTEHRRTRVENMINSKIIS